MNIKAQTFYKPLDIAKNGWIKNSKNSDNVMQNYLFILKEIKAGRLKAKTYGAKGKFHLVSEEEINRYIEGKNGKS